MPPYHFKYGDGTDWSVIYKNKPKPEEVPYFLKPPSTLAPGDQPMILANKYMLCQADHLMQTMKEDAVKVAKDVSPAIGKGIEKVSNPNVAVKTFHINHNLKYDLPSGVALYTADAETMYFTARHEGFTSSDTISLAYRLNPIENIGIRYTDTTSVYTLFLEGSW